MALTPDTVISASSLQQVAFAFDEGYVLELYLPGSPSRVIDTFVFPLAPQRYELEEPFTAVLTPTEGNSVVAEEYGTILREINLEGTFGLKDKRAGNQGELLSGSGHFMVLRNFFRRYSTMKQSGNDADRRVEMRFHAIRDDDHFIVVPKLFATPRDSKTTRAHYAYRIQLTAVERLEVSTLLPFGEENTIENISRALNDARGSLVDLTAQIQQVRVKISDANAIVNNVAGLMRATGNFVKASSDYIFYPWKLAASVLESLEQASDDLANDVVDATAGNYADSIRDFRRMQQALNRIVQFPDRFVEGFKDAAGSEYTGERKLTQTDFDNGTAGATQGARYRLAFGSEARAGIDLGITSTLRSVTVDRTTTLQSLSAKYGVTPESVIILNDLRAPYFAPAGGPGLLGPGDQVLIPSDDGSAQVGTQLGTAADYDTADELLYGRDFAIDQAYFASSGLLDFKVDETHGALDVEIISGVDNVLQGLTIATQTEQGSTVFLPDVGIVSRVGRKGVLANVLLASISLREAVLSDPRVESIAKMETYLENDVLYQEITPRLIDGRVGAAIATSLGKVQG